MINFEEGLTIRLDSERDDTADKGDKEDAATYFIVNELQDCAFIHRIRGSYNDTEQKGFNHLWEVKPPDQSEGVDVSL